MEPMIQDMEVSGLQRSVKINACYNRSTVGKLSKTKPGGIEKKPSSSSWPSYRRNEDFSNHY